MGTTIITKNGSGAPAASDLVAGELAVDLTNKRLYTEDSGANILELGSNPSTIVVAGTSTLTGNVTASSDVSVGGNLTVTGNATIEGNLTFGNAATDTITLTADVASNIVPSADDTYDLGATASRWRDIYIDGTAYLDAINFNGTAITATAAELNILDGVTSTAAELNILDGVTSTAAELNLVDGSSAGTVVNSKAVVYGASGEVNATTLQIAGTSITSTAAELNILDGKAFLDEDDMSSDSATGIASQQSIKAYVDSQVSANNELSEVLSNGNTTGATNIVVTAGQSITTDSILETTAAAGVDIDGVLLKDTSVGTDDASGTDTAGTAVTVKGGAGTGTGAGGSLVFQTAPAAGSTGSSVNAQATAMTIDSTGAVDMNVSLNVDGTVTADGLTSAGDAAITGGSSGSTVLTLTSNALADTPLMVFQRTGGAVAGKLAYEDTNTAMSFGTTTAHELKFLTNNIERMQIDSSGNAIFEKSGGAYLQLKDASAVRGSINVTTSDGLVFTTGASFSEAMRIDSAGDVGIGTTPSYRLHVSDTAADIALFSSSHATTTNFYINNTNATANNTANLYFSPANAVAGAYISAIAIEDFSTSANRTADLAFYTRKDGTFGERVRIDSSGNVKIGTGTDRFSYLTASTANLQIDGGLVFEPGSGNDAEILNYRTTAMIFGNGGAEDMRIDSDGKLLIGTTSNSIYNTSTQADAGILIDGVNDNLQIARYGGTPLFVNRMNTDGTVVDFRKDGTTIGSIGSTSGSMYIEGNPAAGKSGLTFYGSYIEPRDDGAAADAAIDLGISSGRFRDLYLSGFISGGSSVGLTTRAITSGGVAGVQLQQARGSIGSPTTSLAGGDGSYITSSVYDGSAFNKIAQIGLVTGTSLDDGDIVFETAKAGTTTTRMTLDEDGNLLVGKTALDGNTAGFQVEPAGAIAVTRSGSVTAYLNRQTSDGDIAVFRKDGTTVGYIGAYSGETYFAGTASGIKPYSAGIVPTTQDGTSSSGTKSLGASTVKWQDLYLSGGVYLGGTGASNHLDDYETGTWTPVYQGSTTAGTGTYTRQSGVYVKVGDLVYASCTIGISAHTGSGNAQVSGLPFASFNSVANYAAISVSFNNGHTTTSGYQIIGFVQIPTSTVYLYETGGTGQQNPLAMDTAFTEFDFTIVYRSS